MSPRNFVLIVLAVLQTSLLAADADNPVARAKELLALLDKAPKQAEDFEPTAAALEKYLEAHPDDADALVVSARLTFLSFQYAKSDRPRQLLDVDVAAAHKRLDRALALQPDNAEANYWKAWMLFNGGQLGGNPHGTTADDYVRFARRAVELSPREDRYKEGLADAFVNVGKPKEAMKVLAGVRNGQHPVYLILSDMESFPIPEKAVFEPEASEIAGTSLLDSGLVADNWYLRARVYVVPMAAAEVGAFFKKQFPSFVLGKPADVEKDEGNQTAMYQVLFRRAASGWEQVRPLPNQPKDGLVVTIIEFRGYPEMDKVLPIPVGKTFCLVSLHDLRPLPR